MAKKDDEFFIERREGGKYKVLKPDSDRASAVSFAPMIALPHPFSLQV